MKPFIISQMSLAQLRLFTKITHLISRIPGNIRLPSGEDLSCHMIAYAIGMFDFEEDFFLEVVDGWYLGRFNHSWLVDTLGNVYDVYPVGMLTSLEGGPIFVAKEVAKIGTLYESIENRRSKFREMISLGEDPPLDPEKVDLDVIKGDEFLIDVEFIQGFFK